MEARTEADRLHVGRRHGRYVTNVNGANVLYRNRGDGTFEWLRAANVADTGSGTGVAWGDYDGDGSLDLYVANYNEANVLYRNQGNGTFEEVSAGVCVNWCFWCSRLKNQCFFFHPRPKTGVFSRVKTGVFGVLLNSNTKNTRNTKKKSNGPVNMHDFHRFSPKNTILAKTPFSSPSHHWWTWENGVFLVFFGVFYVFLCHRKALKITIFN